MWRNINKLVNEGAEVYYAVFSACEISILSKFPKDILVNEVKAATKRLGIDSNNLFLFKYNVRTFNFKRQEILDDIIKLREKVQPDLVFILSINDLHQDHKTIADEAMRAFKFSSILSYEMSWNNISFKTGCFYKLGEENMEAKIDALKIDESQAHRSYANSNFILSLATVRGVQVNTKYAETFEVLRWII